MKNFTTYRLFQILIGIIWLINGLLCKVFNLVPRHEQIVASILGEQYRREFTIAIGVAETAMAIWILSGRFSRLNALVQITTIAAMNILEFLLVPQLLLWGKWNALFALLLILVIIVNEFFLKNKPVKA